MIRRRNVFILALLIAAPWAGAAQEIRRVIDVAPVWSGHPVGFHLLTHSNRQFVAFYDAARQMTVASRPLSSTNWTFAKLPETVGWDSHNYIVMALDDAGYLHLSGNMHGNPLVYFRSTQPWDVTKMERVAAMVGEEEARTTYPRFLRGPHGELIFTYRTGGSGRGDEIYNVYDVPSKRWRRLLGNPLISGQGEKNAYPHGPMPGPDGYFHLAWIWRQTPDCETSHYICYARSRDLRQWETSAGKPLKLPITFDTCEVIDPVPPGGGAINGNVALGFDAQKRPIVSYHKFDTNGLTQVYNARLEGGAWQIRQATDWKHRWEFSGRGSIEFEVHVRPVTLEPGLGLIQHLSSRKDGSGTWRVEPETLRLAERVHVKSPYPAALRKLASDFPGMQVRLRGDSGGAADGAQYWLRWETLAQNRDRARSGPLPEPSLLQVYEISPIQTQVREDAEAEL
jgi:hypothetical protein